MWFKVMNRSSHKYVLHLSYVALHLVGNFVSARVFPRLQLAFNTEEFNDVFATRINFILIRMTCAILRVQIARTVPNSLYVLANRQILLCRVHSSFKQQPGFLCYRLGRRILPWGIIIVENLSSGRCFKLEYLSVSFFIQFSFMFQNFVTFWM